MDTAISVESKYAFVKKAGLAMFAAGMLFFLISFTAASKINPLLFFILSVVLGCSGAVIFFFSQLKENPIPGVKKNNIMFLSMTNRGMLGWMTAVFLTGMYILIYWFPELLENVIRIFDPLSYTLTGNPANQWFLYGTLYTIAVLVMGVRMIIHNRHNKYQIIRTVSVMFFQLILAYLIPMFIVNGFFFTYFWPLKYEYLFPASYDYLIQSGGIGMFMFFWAAVMSFIATPVLTYFYGKRWYCSWVCGCGAMAETLGDPYRHNSDKSLKSWKIERWMVHSVLLIIIIITALLWIDSANENFILKDFSHSAAKWYGFFIGAMFAGVIGVGFYPLMGSRVWCRFGCPMAAVLGIIQKYFSRFRITVNGGQCISCGNCSTYCEMGIDVKSYAQRGQNVIRASCVGCGVCSEVCPRGVLRLENGPVEGRSELNKDYLR
ncbi:MAG TPA: 4Fe-4S binding protein [Ignavibacteria bacterium]|nr:4Fe-4S binding protein [Ignavibacteria bacterium]HMR41288.1 4Fe-4S binding protein [Ignavibacteria bacterium]